MLGPALLVSIGTTAVLSVILLMIPGAAGGLGFLLFPFIGFIEFSLGNLLLAAIVAFLFGKRARQIHPLKILIIINILFVIVSAGILAMGSAKKSSDMNSFNQKYARENDLANHATDVTQCDAITINSGLWQTCLDSARLQANPAHKKSEELAICLDQASHLHFQSTSTVELEATCRQLFEN